MPLSSRFARIAAASRDTLGIDPYDEQIIAGRALYDGKAVQMQTGEGKTLAAVFAAATGAAERSTVHVLTANDYLARRDAEWMGPLYRALGVSVGFITQDSDDQDRRHAYRQGVTYLTAKQAGFDHLRDGLQYDRRALLHAGLGVAIVDEADFVLIDEARTPLVLASEQPDAGPDPIAADRIACGLERDEHFTVDRAGRRCGLTLSGWQEVDRSLGIDTSDEETARLGRASVHVALHAHHLLTRGVDYIVSDGRIRLIDETTGRIAERRRWPHGIQRALEVKERVAPRIEGRVRGTITIRDFVRLYARCSGMTATAVPAAAELNREYGLATVVIPKHALDRTEHLPDRVFGSHDSKVRAVVSEVKRLHATGRPVLIGTRTVNESNELALLLEQSGVACQVLNATQDGREAELVARAGLRGAVTVATNMAGRGTDIRLGGDGDHDEIVALGGLFVIGTDRHESLRIDLQLRGRAGRQGDPGSTRFFVSLEDDLVQRFAITDLIPDRCRATSGEIDDAATRHEIERAQSIIEEQHAAMRRTLRDYSAIVEGQRRVVSEHRRAALVSGTIPPQIADRCVAAIARSGTFEKGGPGADLLARVFMAEVDEMWTAHLALAEEVREGIHLQLLGHENPLLVYIRTMSDAFEEAWSDVESRTVTRFAELSVAADGRFAVDDAVRAPATTWTYFTSDDPFPAFRVGLVSAANPAAAVVAAATALARVVAAPFAWLFRRGQRTGDR